MIDIGTGDGHYVYQSARRNPARYYIGVDANARALEKISEKICRKTSKGGLPNALFIQAALEDLPVELNGIASEVRVHFPWGSLLRAVAVGEIASLEPLRRVCSSGALLTVIIGVDPDRDSAEVSRLGLAPLSLGYIDSTLAPRYRKSGFKVLDRGALPPSEWPTLQTSWARRLRGDGRRSVFYVLAQAVESESGA